MSLFTKIFKEIFFNRVSPILWLAHWILAIFYFPVWRIFTVVIHPNNEHWLTQVLMLLDFPATLIGAGIGKAIESNPSKITNMLVITVISLQWILVGYFINVLLNSLFQKNEGVK